jgi:hypothetical protein
LIPFGQQWLANGGNLKRTPPYSSGQLGRIFDQAVASALATMLGVKSINITGNSLLPAQPDVVEVGPVRIIGGVRPQNFDVGYRPDGVRFVFDSKTLNDKKSIPKNWQNMVNDLATEATTVHSRFPYAIVAFMVICPSPALAGTQQKALIETLERLSNRIAVDDPVFRAEAIALIVWNPDDGTISTDVPLQSSLLRLEKFAKQIEATYSARYKGLPPHADDVEPSEEVTQD